MIQRETEEIRISMDDLARAKVKRRGREGRRGPCAFFSLSFDVGRLLARSFDVKCVKKTTYR